ncbi:hypothetical protein PMG71_21450 [Roseofilum sp. BLCC_M154]|uniref:CopG-like ribbon-helix-helix domain-containing protein n=1 Tax=Roseofilum acuticapitatum BLCC-M154 TaxID=3022444 RepID=A0ABT7AYP3_9CYAN|nr:hypothetical protein [Roseofilum acuticapitatum]MDJ1172001.1 hypothetical protein [Roseofilum acuticapitatum BLCC-M154]
MISEHLSPELAQVFLDGLPETIRDGLLRRAQQMNYPVWAVLEMAIAGYLDEEALSFTDCQPKLD